MSPDDQRPPTCSDDEATLDDLFRRAVARRRDAVALIDPPNRASFTDGAPRRLTFGEADRIVSAIAARLREINNREGGIVGLQIANSVESVLTFLAVRRAGLVAMPLPLLWRQAEAVEALRAAPASAFIVSGRIGDADHFDLAVRAAADVFSVRQVCGFGRNPPDGVVSVDRLCAAEERPSATDSWRAMPAEQSRAVITWDVSAAGPKPVARSEGELIAGGLAVLLESAIPQDAVILSTIAAGSFGSLATSLVPWLLSGGTLALHHPFDGAVFAAQLRDTDCGVVVVPGPLLPALAEAGLWSGNLERVIGLWRAPEQLLRAPHWSERAPALVDVQVFGELGLIAALRGPTGMPAPIPLGAVTAPRGEKDARQVIAAERTAAGLLALRGPMIPQASLPPGAADRFIDTGFPCRIGADGLSIEVAGPPPGLIGCGGYRFAMHELSAFVSGLDPDGILVALPDALAGHRLAGVAADREAMRTALQESGANPLLVAAFRGHQPQTTDGARQGKEGGDLFHPSSVVRPMSTVR